MPSHNLVPILPPNAHDFSRRVPMHYSGRHFGSDNVLSDPHRNPILDVECGWADLGCKNRQKRAQQRADLMSSVRGSFSPVASDAGPGLIPYIALAFLFVGGFAAIKFI